MRCAGPGDDAERRVSETAAPELVMGYPVLGGAFLMAGRAAIGVKQALEGAGLEQGLVRRAGICAYEAEMNIVIYGRSGTLTVELYPTEVRIIAQDRGPGIPDVSEALRPGFSTASEKVRGLGFGAGMGLPNMQRHADRLQIETVLGMGTRVVMHFTRQAREDDAAGPDCGGA